MPWHIEKRDGKFCVIKNQDNTNEGCSATEKEAQNHMAALYANEQNTPPASERFYVSAPIEKVDVRDSSTTHDQTWTMSGYAAVFNQQATFYSDQFSRETVQIDPHAFDRVLAEQGLDTPEGAVHFNFGHDMNRAIAATDVAEGQPGSLKLDAHPNGLHFLARVAKDDPDGIALASKMRAGVVRQASFAFQVRDHEWVRGGDEEYEEVHRRINEIQQLFDVCAAPQGRFPQTVSNLQTYARLLGQPDEGGRHRQPDLGGENVVSPESEGDGDSQSAEERDALINSVQALERIRDATWHGGLVR